MEMTRIELLDGVWLNHLHDKKAEKACLSIHLLTQLTRESAAMNALLPAVLRRGCARYGDEAALEARLAKLDATIEASVRLAGEIQALGFCAALPADADSLRPVCELLGELLLNPETRGGLLLPGYVDAERDKLAAALRRPDAAARCLAEMCCCEDFAIGRCGSAEDADAIRYQKLSKHYRTLLPVCPVEIFYCGNADKKRLAAVLREVLATLPRGEIDLELGTQLRMNALEDQPRVLHEQSEDGQAHLVIGWRLGSVMEDPDQAALSVFRELVSQTLAASLPQGHAPEVLLDIHKGLLLVSLSDDDARELVLSQLALLRAGDFSDERLERARRGASEALLEQEADPQTLERFWFSQLLLGLDYGPAELSALCAEVRREELCAVTDSLDCDMIYLSTPAEADKDHKEEEE